MDKIKKPIVQTRKENREGKKAKRKDPTEIDIEDLTEEDLQELLNPGAKVVKLKKKEDKDGNSHSK